MSSFLRTSLRISRTSYVSPTLVARVPRRWAGDYGSDQSGHQQDRDAKNPRKDLEHPGPESPVSKGGSSGSSQASQSSSPGSSSSGSEGQGSPAIHRPKSAAEDQDPEVRKHNEEMAQRHDRSHNQLSEEDNKVDKQFWKGDVGNVKTR